MRKTENEKPQAKLVTIHSRDRQRRVAEVVGFVRGGPRVDKLTEGPFVVPGSSPKHRSLAVHVGFVHVGLCVNKLADYPLVAIFGGRLVEGPAAVRAGDEGRIGLARRRRRREFAQRPPL